MIDKPDVVNVNKVMQVAMLNTGRLIPITHWFDWRGEECDPFSALTCVAGADDVGWYSIDLEHFKLATVH